jgi:molecular chaperone GrpE
MHDEQPLPPTPEAAEAANAAASDLEAQLKAEHLRLLADLDNQRKRMARELEQARKYAAERLLGELLPVLDSLEAGLASARGGADAAKLAEGLELTQRMLAKAVENGGLKAIDPTGEAFNPEAHQAMSVVETGEHAPGTVVTVFQKGYRLNERLLRPALVAVAKEPPPPEDA